MELIFFTILYRYKPELIKEAKSIKIIIKKVRILINKFWKLHTELIINIKFILKKAVIY